jgi:flavin reductase (DIM6/NTAB) family NADH-FMN oxidoreductase RutF
MVVDAGAFHRTVDNFLRSVTLISSSCDGKDHAVTASTFTVVSFRQRRVAVILHRASRLTAMIQRSGVWGVSLFGSGDVQLAKYFSRTGRPVCAEVGDLTGRRGPVTGVPLLDDALALLECRSVGELDAGDHVVFLGEPVWLADLGTGATPLCAFRGALGVPGSPTASHATRD